MNKVIEHLNGLKKVELSGLVELVSINELNKLKTSFLSEWKAHVSKRDAWGAAADKILMAIGEQERSGEKLKLETKEFEKKIIKISTQVDEISKITKSLGVDIPKLNELDGISIGAYGNTFADTNIMVDKFQKNKK